MKLERWMRNRLVVYRDSDNAPASVKDLAQAVLYLDQADPDADGRSRVDQRNLGLGNVVSDVQTVLAHWGYEPGPVDGLWGPQTQAAWQRFLYDHKSAHRLNLDRAEKYCLRATHPVWCLGCSALYDAASFKARCPSCGSALRRDVVRV